MTAAQVLAARRRDELEYATKQAAADSRPAAAPEARPAREDDGHQAACPARLAGAGAA